MYRQEKKGVELIYTYTYAAWNRRNAICSPHAEILKSVLLAVAVPSSMATNKSFT